MSADDLGLDGLSDDQLVALGRAVFREIGRRDETTQDVASRMALSERERLVFMRDATAIQIAAVLDQLRRDAETEVLPLIKQRLAEVQEQERLRIRHDLALEKARLRREKFTPLVTLAALISDAFGPGWIAERWEKDGDIRLYLSGPDFKREDGPYGIQKTGTYIEYYMTGSKNGRYLPGQMKVSKFNLLKRKNILRLVEYIIAQPFVKIDCTALGEMDLTPNSFPEWYEELKNGK